MRSALEKVYVSFRDDRWVAREFVNWLWYGRRNGKITLGSLVSREDGLRFNCQINCAILGFGFLQFNWIMQFNYTEAENWVRLSCPERWKLTQQEVIHFFQAIPVGDIWSILIMVQWKYLECVFLSWFKNADWDGKQQPKL